MSILHPRSTHSYTLFTVEEDRRTLHVQHSFKVTAHFPWCIGRIFCCRSMHNGLVVSNLASVQGVCCVRKAYHVRWRHCSSCAKHQLFGLRFPHFCLSFACCYLCVRLRNGVQLMSVCSEVRYQACVPLFRVDRHYCSLLELAFMVRILS